MNRRDVLKLLGTAIVVGLSVITNPASVLAGSGTIPTGTMLPFAASIAPEGWLLCDGGLVPEQYTKLFELIGEDWKNKLPDLRNASYNYIIKT